ncbi:MAG TPA: hypothetical protein VNQ73_05735 [Ilumatobacter sp.]|nr:hypothetical protein [Ilumatobacter sp.]
MPAPAPLAAATSAGRTADTAGSPGRGGQASTVDFAGAARTLTSTARSMGLIGPSFRCPPRLVGVDRTIRRRGDGAIVAVRLRERPWPAVLADMIEGVVVANALHPPAADRVRADLWRACAGQAGDTERHVSAAA